MLVQHDEVWAHTLPWLVARGSWLVTRDSWLVTLFRFPFSVYVFMYVNPCSWAMPMAITCEGTRCTPGFRPATRSARTSATGSPVTCASCCATRPSATLHCQNTVPLACIALTLVSPSDRKMFRTDGCFVAGSTIL